MPEAPEVRNYFIYIKPILDNERIITYELLSGKYTNKKNISNVEKLENLKIIDIILKGKTIFIKCTQNISIAFVHGMTGYYSTEKEKHSRFVLYLEDNNLYFNDPRNFGTITVYTSEEEFNKAYNKLGPDILNHDVSYEEFYSRIDKKSKLEIGHVLLDQNIICGIGNYLRCDILWYSKINHYRKIGSLTENEKKLLYNASINIIKYHAGLEYKLDVETDEEFFVYMQDEDLYGNEVLREKYRGRTIHYVEW
jgi:formamidopyrimidine-DNA glycosylase